MNASIHAKKVKVFIVENNKIIEKILHDLVMESMPEYEFKGEVLKKHQIKLDVDKYKVMTIKGLLPFDFDLNYFETFEEAEEWIFYSLYIDDFERNFYWSIEDAKRSIQTKGL